MICRSSSRLWTACGSFGFLALRLAASQPEPIPVKAVIVVTYEEGAYTGDKPGGLPALGRG